MANRPKGYGLTREIAEKNAAKFDPDLANDMLDWIRVVFEEEKLDTQSLPDYEIETGKEVQQILQDGVILCRLVNCIKSGLVKKINNGQMAFKMMENICMFLAACEKLGCKQADLFQSVDLYEGVNIPQVINGICALGRKAYLHYDGPCLGPEEATQNKRSFTAAQLRAGEGVIGLQAGTNKGASQAGLNFGKTRAIID